ncbi:kinase-like domain-containing protein [Hypoxylon rubiginosum]|uniref:Kinase-like domain-containing protein n=1 Tax=Hypoxylon rubiginosum TaxID=110542 RepID=A0ACB9YJS5_9PEZI|nr:kinase-like domain-containing protein [Hypoxylon rubiginosum]
MFDQEANGLEQTRGIICTRSNIRMVKAIAAIRTTQSTTTKSNFYFIFPWAEEGNLSDVWRNHHRLDLSEERITWFLKEITELSDAICALHNNNPDGNPEAPNNFGSHGDLKPENILCFLREGSEKMLYVADMGLVKFHSISTGARPEPTGTSEDTDRYLPPEEKTSLPSQEKKRSRSTDIWSLGCIFLEFVAWLLYGFEELSTWKSHFIRSTRLN